MHLFHATGTSRREQLAWTEQARRVECVAEAGHYVEVLFGEHAVHEVELFEADAVLAGDAAAAGDALQQDFLASRQDALDFLRVPLVEEEDRVQVAVAGVEYIDDADIMSGTYL